MLHRYYVRIRSDLGETPGPVNALVYAESRAEIGPDLGDNLHIVEENHDDKRWWLPLENADELSNDLAHLESRLMGWARASGWSDAPESFPPLAADAQPEEIAQ